MTKAISYTRVSYRHKQDGERSEGYSFEQQSNEIAEYARKHGIDIVKSFSELHSAFSPGRPVFEEMIDYLTSHGEVAVLLVYKLDRLARNLVDYSRLQDVHSVRVVSVTEDFSDDANGRTMSDIMAVFARHYSAVLGERTRGAMLTKARSGIYPTYAPTGYINHEGNISPNPESAPLVGELFRRYSETDVSLERLVQWAAERGLRSRSGHIMQKGTVGNLLQNPVYIGKIRWRGEVYQGSHEPLVSDELFKAVQDKMHGRAAPRTTRLYFPYRGLVVCGYCGCMLTAERKKGKYVYYHCTQSKGKCSQPYYSQDTLSERLLQVIEDIQMTRENALELMNLAMSEGEESEQRRRAEKARLQAEANLILERIDAMYEDKLDGSIDQDQWEHHNRRQTLRLELVRSEIRQIEEPVTIDIDTAETVLELAQRLPELYLRKPHEERARALKVVASNCVLTADSVEPVYKEPFAAIAKWRRGSDWLPGEDSNLQPFG